MFCHRPGRFPTGMSSSGRRGAPRSLSEPPPGSPALDMKLLPPAPVSPASAAPPTSPGPLPVSPVSAAPSSPGPLPVSPASAASSSSPAPPADDRLGATAESELKTKKAKKTDSEEPRLGKKTRRVRMRAQGDEGESDGEQDDDEASILSGLVTQAGKLKDFMAGGLGTGLLHLVSEKRTPEQGRKLPPRNLHVPEHYESIGDFVKWQLDRKRKKEAGIPEDPPIVGYCDQGHELVEAQCKKPRTCKSCGERIQRGEQLHKCVEKECRWYVCSSCFIHGPPPEPPEPDYEAEAFAQQRFEAAVDELHKAALQDDGRRVRLLLAGPDESKHLPHPDIAMESTHTPVIKAAKYGCAFSCAALLDCRADPAVRDDSPRYFGDGVWPNEKRPDMYGKVDPHDRKDAGALPGRTVVYWLRIKGKLDDVLANVFPMTRVNLVRSIAAAVQDHAGEPAVVAAARAGSAELTALLLTHMAPGLPALVPPPGSPGSPTMQGSTGAGWTTCTSGWASSLETGTNFATTGFGTTGFGTTGMTAGRTTGFGTTGMTAGRGTQGSTGVLGCTSPIHVHHEKANALLVACTQKEWKTATIIIGSGVSGSHMSTTKDRLGRTPLHVAACFGAEDVVILLLKAGHPFRLTSFRGRQPLHEACASGHAGAAAALLEAKADPFAPTEEDRGDRIKLPGPKRSNSKRGLTAVDMAAEKPGRQALGDLLLMHSAAAGGRSPKGSRASPGALRSGAGRCLTRVASEPLPAF